MLPTINNGHAQRQRMLKNKGEIKAPMENIMRRHLRHVVLSIIVLLVLFIRHFLNVGEWWRTGRRTGRHVDTEPYYVSYPDNYKFIMGDTYACNKRAVSPFLVLVVPVAPADRVARGVIRSTWGNQPVVWGKRVQTVFMLGLPTGADARELQGKLRAESRQHRDLIQGDFEDSYRNLTIKTMMMLQWLNSNCSGAAYAMKIDSDMFLNVRNLVRLLLDPSTPRHNFMTGLVWWNSPVIRDPSDKFYMPREIIAKPEYPPYPLGMGYVLSLDLPGKLLEASAHVRPIYIEDAYLGMCMKHLSIAPTNPPEESFIVNPVFSLGRCSLAKVIAVTTTSVSQMVSYWLTSQESEAGC